MQGALYTLHTRGRGEFTGSTIHFTHKGEGRIYREHYTPYTQGGCLQGALYTLHLGGGGYKLQGALYTLHTMEMEEFAGSTIHFTHKGEGGVYKLQGARYTYGGGGVYRKHYTLYT